jgi:hypothetical protein
VIEQFDDHLAYAAKLLLDATPAARATIGTLTAGDTGKVAIDAVAERAEFTFAFDATGFAWYQGVVDVTDAEFQSGARRAAFAWAAARPALPSSGTLAVGATYTYGGEMWRVLQAFNRSTFNAEPSTYPSLIRLLRSPVRRYAWAQPIDQYDAYLLVNALTGQPDEVTHAGQSWRTRRNNNVWTPGASDSGWMQISGSPVPWYYLGAEGYPVGTQVTYNGHRWQALTANTNWAPGVVGGQFQDLGVYP